MAAPLRQLSAALKRKLAKVRVEKQLPMLNVLSRCLHLQEYQSKTLMKEHEIEVQHFEVVDSVEDSKYVPARLHSKEYVVKAQILAGGRGKGIFSNGFQGGVKLTTDPEKVVHYVDNMLGHKLTTKQTPPGGVLVKKVMIAEALNIISEKYFAILLDWETNGPLIVGSHKGGMDIEEVARTDPSAIFKEPIDIMEGITEDQVFRITEKLGFKGDHFELAADQIRKLYKMFVDVDATQIEVNPFGETDDGRVVCFDAKMNFDDNAEYRQGDIFKMDDLSETDPREVEAALHHLNYIGMEGSIGCLVNGAGLAMATMDIVKLHGGEPANFLDVGGGVTEQQVYNAFHLLTSDAHVKAILVNVFAGIVNCNNMANGIIKAYKEAHISCPMVIRLEGNHADTAMEILRKSGLPIIVAEGMNDAAKKVVEAVKALEKS